MKSLEEIKVSVYENVYSKKPQTMSFLEVISSCIRPVYADAINTIRRYYTEGDHEAAQKLKSKLSCFTPAGTFNGAHAIRNFATASHIIGLDYDHVQNRLAIIQRCATDPHTVAAIESPTDGVKIFAYVEGIEEHHREGQQLVSHYYDELLHLESDPACKDESRLCYFTYSPNGYIAGLYQPFVLESASGPTFTSIPDFTSTPLPVSTPASEEPEKTVTQKVDETKAEEETKGFVSSYIFLYPLTSGHRHTHLFKLACEASRRRYPEEMIVRELTLLLQSTDFPLSELKSVINAGYQRSKKQQSTMETPSAATSQKDKKTEETYIPSDDREEAEDAYWQGEEFRKKTPYLPNDLFENLPNLLEDCLLDEGNNRERDISFLANIIALSAVLPQTFGIYNHKKYSPHLFSVVISPAGSGKSVAQTGRYMLEEIHSGILSNSKLINDKYIQEHTHWLTACAHCRKKGEETPDEPHRPPFKLLVIPATTSYTRMQMQMQDNDSLGSIIFDTEAQTLSTANHLDCGNFDDMLRKAFEHEQIDSLYKVNGICPIYIRHPRLAMFLTGTPGQLLALLSSSENGLASRILYYTYRESPCWKEMGDESISMEDYFEPIAHRVSILYAFCQANPALFHFSRGQWDRLNKIFSHLLSEVVLEGNDDLQAVVKRYACMVMRISMILTRLRQFESNDTSTEIYCSDTDFEHSLEVVLCCYEHSRLLLSSMSTPNLRPLKDPDNIRNFINDLPDTFSTEEAIKVGVKYNFNNRKITRLLKSLNGVKINKVSHGVYTKLSSQ